MNRSKLSSGSIHTKLLKKYNYPNHASPDGLGTNFINNLLKHNNDIEYFGCGSLDSIKHSYINGPFPKYATIQGGFVSYEYLEQNNIFPKTKLQKFYNQSFVPTFNLNSNIEAGKAFLDAPFNKRCVSKNLCHTIIYDKIIHEQILKTQPKSRAGKLLREGMHLYLLNHPNGKKFHDPTATVLHLHPEIGSWTSGRLIFNEGKWETINLLPHNCEIIGDINNDSLFNYIAKGI